MSHRPTYDPSSAVDAALTKLARFTEQNAEETIPHVFHFEDTSDPKNTSSSALGKVYQIKKEMKMFRSCIAAIFSTETRQNHDQMREEVQNDLLDAIDILKDHHRYIYQLNGTDNPIQKALVTRFFATINAFNALIDTPASAPKQPKNLWHIIRSYLCTASGLSITKELTSNKIMFPSCQEGPVDDGSSSLKILSNRFQIHSQTPETQKVASLFLNSKISKEPIKSEQDHELFWMKALSLLRNQHVLFDSVEEEFECVKQAPIYTTLTPHYAEGSTSPCWILEMRQILTPFPGEKMIIKGQLMKTSQTSRSVPVQNSFSLAFITNQTGFPYCSQYTGWALCDALIPKCPHRLHLLPLVSPLLQTKLETSKELAAAGRYCLKVKTIYRLKKKVFNENHADLLPLHETLCIKLMQQEAKLEIISQYFSFLHTHLNPFDSLAETFQSINECFLIKPYMRLQLAWVEQNPTLSDESGRRHAAEFFLNHEIELQTQAVLLQQEKANTQMEIAALKFIAHMGSWLGKASIPIMLQEFSEIMHFEPLALDLFAQTIQMQVYQQLLYFQKELLEYEDLNSEVILKALKTQLEADIALFSIPEISADSRLMAICEELRDYFQARHLSRKEKLR